jgi:hypothetical protein
VTDLRLPGAFAVDAARRVLARTVGEQPREPDQLAEALLAGLGPVVARLRESMGDDGCRALVGRASSRAELAHPAVAILRGDDERSVSIDSVRAMIEAHGGAATTAAVEHVLAELTDILARLIGDDMALQIVDPDLTQPLSGGGVEPP